MGKIRILLIEDNRLLRESITTILDTQPDFEIITRVGKGNIVEQLKSMKRIPHIVLLDFRLPIQNKLSLLLEIKSEYPQTKVIAINIVPDEVDIIGIVKAGGSGFILREASCYDLINTIRKVEQGESVLPADLTNSLFYQLINHIVTPNKDVRQEYIKLTNREKDVIDLISEGLCNKEIGRTLHVSTETVKSHVHNILKKLALNTRLQIANFNNTQKYRQYYPVYYVKQQLNSCNNDLHNTALFPTLNNN